MRKCFGVSYSPYVRVDMFIEANQVEQMVKTVSENLYDCAYRSKQEPQVVYGEPVSERWERLLENKDDLQLWRAINWKDEYGNDSIPDCRSSDNEFKQFYESSFYHPDAELTSNDYNSNVYIPVLDDPITSNEVQQQIKRLEPDKACGPDGVPPGVFKIMCAQWITVLATIFNVVFLQGAYPLEWSRAKFVIIFKKGR